MPWPPPSTPAIVAEAFASVTHPVRTALVPGRPGIAPDVVRALAATVAPAAATDAPPPWLFPSQRRAYARTLAALRRFRGALLAEPTGSGKTFIALAVAWRWQAAPVACVVPAALTAKWRAAAAALGVPVTVASHEQVSRGRLPSGTRGLVLIDESHHFRHPDILRYGHLADFLVGRPALLISATPVVNRIEDLAHQLRLAVRDDALAAQGLSSLAGALASAPSALGAVVIATDAAGDRLPLRTSCALRPPLAVSGHTLLQQIAQLRLSADGTVARLIRGVLWRAMASSPAALLGALRRYDTLLAHAADARAGGRTLPRAKLRQWVGGVAEQLVFWELMPAGDVTCDSDLVLDDATALRRLVDAAHAAVRSPDPKLDQLQALLADGRPTLIFCASRDTVGHLRRRLTGTIGWCTGEAAGIAGHRVSRAALFTVFGQATGPRVLVASDVAAEGLDLQAAERVVHYDLPWTATRLEQREGRAARLGSQHAVVATVRFDPPPALERRLRQCAILTRSALAPASIGIGSGPDAAGIWQWRDTLARRLGDGPVHEGVAAVRSTHEGFLAGIAFEDERTDRRVAATLLWLDRDGQARSDPAWLVARAVEAASPVSSWPSAELDAALVLALDALARPVARLLRRVQQARWNSPPRSPGTSAVIRRLTYESRDAARRRDVHALAALERALAIVSGGLTAGEIRIVERLAAGTWQPESRHSERWAPLVGLPPRSPEPGAVSVRLTGVILFGPS